MYLMQAVQNSPTIKYPWPFSIHNLHNMSLSEIGLIMQACSKYPSARNNIQIISYKHSQGQLEASKNQICIMFLNNKQLTLIHGKLFCCRLISSCSSLLGAKQIEWRSQFMKINFSMGNNIWSNLTVMF